MIHGGVPAIFSVLESSEVKFPALEGFVLPTDIHVSRGTRLIFNLHGDFHRTLFGAIFVLSLFRERKVALCGHF